MGFILTFLSVVLGSILLGIAIFLAVARYILGTPTGASSGWLAKLRSNKKLNDRLPLIFGLGILILFWGPIANLLAGYLASSDMGNTFGLEEATVRGLLWVPFLLLGFGVLGTTLGMQWLGGLTQSVITLLLLLGTGFLMYSAIFEGSGAHRVGCGLVDRSTGPANRIEIMTHEVVTVGVCPGEWATLQPENGRPPTVRFNNLSTGESTAFADLGVTPYHFIEVRQVGSGLYQVTALQTGFTNSNRDSIELVFTISR